MNPTGSDRVRLTLLIRAYCHLCDDMRAALAPLARRYGVIVAELDVDADPALESRFGERVPVLLLGSPGGDHELCHYVLDRARVAAALDSLSPPGQVDGAAR